MKADGREGPTPPRALIADDHVPTRTGVRMTLERDGFDVCAEAANAADAVAAALRERPDVCLLDVHMPGGGPAAASMIAFRLPETVVLMLTVSRAEEDLFESLRRGATGYLLKDIDPPQLTRAVRAALAGEAAIPRALASSLVEQFRQRPHSRGHAIQVPGRAELTGREWEVLELLGEDAETAEIARRLFLSRVTVRRHVSNIVRKLDVSSREEAVRLLRSESAVLTGSDERARVNKNYTTS